MTSSATATSTSLRPGATGLSAALHIGALVGLLVMAWWSQRTEDEPDKMFELVPDPGDNYAATEAPSTPAPEPAVSLTLPAPQPRPTPPRPQPTPQPAPQPAPQPVVVKKAPPKIEKAPEKPAVKIEPVREQVSFDDFKSEHGQPKAQPVRNTPKPITAKTINVDQVLDRSTSRVTEGAGGTAMTSNEIDMSRRYVALIIQRIRQSMEAAGITELREAGVQFSVSLSGAITDAHITRSSGSGSFDRAVLAAFKSIRPVGSPPTRRAEVFKTVIRLSE